MDDEIFAENLDDDTFQLTPGALKAAYGDNVEARKRAEMELSIAAAEVTATRNNVRLVKEVIKHFGEIAGFVVGVILYSILGGLLFEELESKNEIYMCKSARSNYQSALSSGVQTLNNLRTDFTMGIEERQQAVRHTLETFREAFYNSTWDGTDCDTMVSSWSGFSASVFCITVITTIGYGHITPMTSWGRIVVICYALFGMPLTLVMLAKLGNFLAEIAQFSYHVLCCCDICRKEKQLLSKGDKKKILRKYFRENHSQFYEESIRTVVLLPEEDRRRVGYFDIFGDTDDTSSEDELNEDDLEIQKMENLSHVPWPISLIIIASTVFIGGSIFAGSEDWALTDSIYFSFITVSTIGFGDIYPSLANVGSAKTRLRLTIWALFIIAGLAIMSMCLNMIQLDVGSKLASVVRACSSRNSAADLEDERDREEKDCAEFSFQFYVEKIRRGEECNDIPRQFWLALLMHPNYQGESMPRRDRLGDMYFPPAVHPNDRPFDGDNNHQFVPFQPEMMMDGMDGGNTMMMPENAYYNQIMPNQQQFGVAGESVF